MLTTALVSSSSWGVSQASSLCRPQWLQVGPPLPEVGSHACLARSGWGPCLRLEGRAGLDTSR